MAELSVEIELIWRPDKGQGSIDEDIAEADALVGGSGLEGTNAFYKAGCRFTLHFRASILTPHDRLQYHAVGKTGFQ